MPNLALYQELGYKSKSVNTKHYRRRLDTPLDVPFIGKEIFSTLEIHRGKMLIEEKGFFEKFFSLEALEGENFRKTGNFKGTVEVIEKTVFDRLTSVNIPKEIKDKFELNYSSENWGNSKLEKDLLSGQEVIITLNVISALFY